MDGRGLRCDTQAENFHAMAALYRRGGPLAPQCGARTRAGSVCTQLPISDGKGRCLRHAGPTAAKAFRARQLRELTTGKTTPEEFARAEARRGRNRLLDGWKRNPSLPGSTIDLGHWMAQFVDATSALGVDMDGMLPAVRNWLAWRFKRTQIDRSNDAGWVQAVRGALPVKIADADRAMVWVRLGNPDKRTKTGRALKIALRTGGEAYARALAVSEVADGAPVDGLTGTPLRPWTPPLRDRLSKRALPDRPKAPKKVPARRHIGPGRPRKGPPSDSELTALMGVLREAGPAVRTMYAACTDDATQLDMLRALQAFHRAPNNKAAQTRWMGWVRRLR